jgi:hypothetical protein
MVFYGSLGLALKACKFLSYYTERKMYYTTPSSVTKIQYFVDTRRVSCLTSRTKCLVLGIFATKCIQVALYA